MVEKFIIHPGKPLNGAMEVSGAKNAVLPVLAGSLLTAQPCTISNVPNLSDVESMRELVESLGGNTNWNHKSSSISVDAGNLMKHEAAYELVGRLRASFLIVGPLLARLGRARVPLPGGCAIGSRPVDLHLKGLAALGAKIEHSQGYVEASAKKLYGANIYLDFPSVGATENIMMAAALADGQTVIENAAIEPEIVDLANFINTAGGQVRGAGTDTIKITGVKFMNSTQHSIISDRIEAGTFMVAAALTGGDIILTNVMGDHVKPVTAKLKEVNVQVHETDKGIQVNASESPLVAADIKTLPYPGFPTDMQAQFMSLLTKAKGTSIITETVFENRFMQVGELKRMGADIKIESRSAIIKGVDKLTGTNVCATDLRAGAALVLAALAADNITEVTGISHIDRGYCQLDKRLNQLGARIERVKDNIVIPVQK